MSGMYAAKPARLEMSVNQNGDHLYLSVLKA